MDSNVDLELAELPGLKDYNQHHKIQLKASHQQCAPWVSKLFNSLLMIWMIVQSALSASLQTTQKCK